MKLTGRTKEDFNQWYEHQEYIIEYANEFIHLPKSMQYGVYVDFFRETLANSDYLQILEDIYNSQRLTLDELSQSRDKAISKANDIYNSG
jgi:Zn-dependent M32 family carboxypeptidase